MGGARVIFSAVDFRTLDLPRNKYQPIALDHVCDHFCVTRASCGLVLLHMQFAAYTQRNESRKERPPLALFEKVGILGERAY
jgi:hypothetical protein